MKILFMGTPEPAAKCLKALIDAGEEVVGVVTQPDRPKGRGLKLTQSPVKELALKNNLPVLQPDKVRDQLFLSEVKSLDPAVVLVVAYGKLLPKEFLDIPPYGCFNVHASLLPKYRGAAPVQWAIMNGDKETGVTVFKIKETLDTGDILLQRALPIENDDTSKTLFSKVFDIAAEALVESVKIIKSGKLKLIKQDDKKVTYAPILKKENGFVAMKQPAKKIYDKIRACDPWPGSFTYHKGKTLKIWKAEVIDRSKCGDGEILEIVKNEGFITGTCDGALKILEVQPESGKRMSAYQYAIGHNIKAGDSLPS